MVETIDHIAQSKDLMLSQFENKPTINALLDSWLTPLQNMEDDLIAFMNANGINTGSGEMLDIIGTWFGLTRDSRTDPEFRAAILSRALLSRMDGTTEKFLEGGRVLCNTEYFTFYEYFPATGYAHSGEGYNNSTLQELRRIAPAGVHVRLLVDVKHNSFTLANILFEDNALVTGDGEEYIVDIAGEKHTLVTNLTDSIVLDNRGSTLPELFQDEFDPLPSLVVKNAKSVSGFLVDNNGNQIVDNNGIPFTVIEYEY